MFCVILVKANNVMCVIWVKGNNAIGVIWGKANNVMCVIWGNNAMGLLQVEFEAVKLELTHKQEEQELLRAHLEEAGRLREIAERQLEEALEALKEEREQKNSLRRELSALAATPFGAAAHLELHLEQLEESQDEGQGEDQDSGYNPGLASASRSNGYLRFSTPRSSGIFLRPPAPSLVSDLLSELHLSDSQKLQQQLLQVPAP